MNGFSKDFNKASNFANLDVETIFIHIDDIIVKDQVRKKFENIDSFAQSILSDGKIFNDLIVYRISEGFVLNQGERRLRAARLLVEQGHDEFVQVPCKVVEFDSEEDAFHAQLNENVQRDDLDAFELAEAFSMHQEKFDKKHGWMTRLAEKRGHSKQFISRHYALLSIDPAIRELFDKELVTSPRSMLLIDKHEHTDKVCEAILIGTQLSDALLIGQPIAKAAGDEKGPAEDQPGEPESKKSDKKKTTGDPDLFPKFTSKNIKAMVTYLMDKENLGNYDAVLEFLNNIENEE